MIVIRDAVLEDIGALVALYADDVLGRLRESPGEPLDEAYRQAFLEIDGDPRHRLVVAEDDGALVATLQLSFLPQLVLRGGERAQIEAVRVRSDRRGRGVGEELLRWAVAEARARGCRLVQLTTDRSRRDAQRFYERLGFTPSHIGMKLALDTR